MYFASQIKKGEKFSTVIRGLYSYFSSFLKGYDNDRFNTFSILVERAQETKSELILYLLCNDGTSEMEGDYTLSDTRISKIISDLKDFEFVKFGLHGSYDSFSDSEKLLAEKSAVEHSLKSNELETKITHSRQHYLRWDNSVSPGAISNAGIKFDSTLGFAETSGFRSACCMPYPIFDLVAREHLPVVELPLVLLERSFLKPKYLGLHDIDRSLEYALALKNECVKYRGLFTLLWHNSSLYTDKERTVFYRLTAEAATSLEK